VFEALRGPKQLLMVPDAGHNDVLNGSVWRQIEEWLVKNVTGKLKVQELKVESGV
jgi:hypothetical protein